MLTKSFYLFTNRNTLVFNEDGEQCVEDQRACNCYDVDKDALQKVLDQCSTFYISKYSVWIHVVSKKEIEYLLGLRTRELDTAELKNEFIEMPKKSH